MKLDAWLDLLRRHLSVRGVEIDRATERALLDLARVAAHASERIAGPISTYLVGLALMEVPADERARRVEAIVDALEQEPGVQG